MAEQHAPGSVVFIAAPIEVARRFKALARRNRRTITGEGVIALKRHLERERMRQQQSAG
jgi:hypothetical protein